MTLQLGPLPSALTAQSDLCTRAHGLPSQGRAPQAPCPSDQQAPRSQQAHGSMSGQHQPPQQKSLAGSLSIKKGKLDLLHEVACPLYLELAKTDPNMASLVMAMLRYDPEQRISAAEALQHPFLSELSPLLQLVTAKREANSKSQGGDMGSTETPAQGVSQQQGCQAEAVTLDQAAGTLRPTRNFGLPFKPEPRRQAIVSLPPGGHPTSQAAVPTWDVGRFPMPSDPLLLACQPQTAQPQLRAAQCQLQASPPQLQASQPQLQASQPQLQASQPQLQASQSQLQPPHSKYVPPNAQKPVISSPNRTAGMTAAEVRASATASAAPQPIAAASAAEWHNLPEGTAHDSRGVQLPAVLPAVVPTGGPSDRQTMSLLASYEIAKCTIPAQSAGATSSPLAAAVSPPPAQQADPSSPLLVVSPCPLPQQGDPPSAPLTASLTAIPRHTNQHGASGDGLGSRPLTQHSSKGGQIGWGHGAPALGSGQGPCPAVGAVDSSKGPTTGAGAVATPMALEQGPVKTPGLVKAWNGVTELLQQMSPGSQVILFFRLLPEHWAKDSALHTTAFLQCHGYAVNM